MKSYHIILTFLMLHYTSLFVSSQNTLQTPGENFLSTTVNHDYESIPASTSALNTQPDPTWDDTSRPTWPDVFKDVSIPSTADGAIQKAYFYSTTQEKPRPLVVSLHTWSNNYQQKDPLIDQILLRDYNYIRPDFRGPNNTPEAMGSPLVASDIDDAITYAIENGNVDPHNIHIIGASGGGYATLIAYMQSEHNIRTFSAWVPITDISKWYYESLGRKRVYAKHIALATTGSENRIDLQEARRRSPLFMSTPVEKRESSQLYIYAGIHDGYNGSVPVSHSLEIFNKVVKDFNPVATEELIPEHTIQQIVTARYLPGENKPVIADREIQFQQRFSDKMEIVIFEGAHEMLVDVALNHIPSETILAIGDSNGAKKGGWVDQLQEIRFGDTFINTCISGNTIGFDNNGWESKNTLKNIRQHLIKHDPDRNRLDKILILLGTNDCKRVFDSIITVVPENYRLLLNAIESYYEDAEMPTIVMVSPPPIGKDEIMQEKYHGGARRVVYLNTEFRAIAHEKEYQYIDLQPALWPLFDEISPDGIHFNEQGYQLLGFLIDQHLE
jgi:lysophospholipase L1-like esterase/dienelactone hydrolase